MSISESDVRHVAALARLGLTADRIPSLVGELNGILAHMEILQRVDMQEVANESNGEQSMPLREDVPVPGVPDAERSAFAPATRDGFFLVPRLDTHGQAGSSDAADGAGHA